MVTPKNNNEITAVRNVYYYLLVLGLLTFISGAMRLWGFFLGRLTGWRLVLHALYALAVSCYCFYTSQEVRKFTRRGYYLALGFACFMALAAALACLAAFRADLLSAFLMAFLSVLSVYMAWTLLQSPVRGLFVNPPPGKQG